MLYFLNLSGSFDFFPNSGYLAPEYVLGGQLTLKADVYSFGVLTLEVVSGRSSGHTNYGGGEKLLVEWVGTIFSLLPYSGLLSFFMIL